jgi:sugar/nucleoside kinase (ribokinase family)
MKRRRSVALKDEGGGYVSVVGRVYVDHVFAGFTALPTLGTEVYGDAYSKSIGGGAAITACWLGAMGRPVQLACVVGEADLQWFRTEVERVGVNTELVASSRDNTGVTAAIVLDGDREFFTYLGANRELERQIHEHARLSRLCASRHLHITAPLPPTTARMLIDCAHQAGGTVSLDVGYQPAWYKDQANLPTLQDVDLFFPNEVEAKLLGLSTPAGLQTWLASDSDLATRAVRRWVVVKRGRAGAIAASRDVYVAVEPPPTTNVDTTGAGDAFDAGFIDGFLRGGSAKDWLRRACVCGALSVTQLGGVAGAANEDKINQVIESTYGI